MVDMSENRDLEMMRTCPHVSKLGMHLCSARKQIEDSRNTQRKRHSPSKKAERAVTTMLRYDELADALHAQYPGEKEKRSRGGYHKVAGYKNSSAWNFLKRKEMNTSTGKL